MARRALIVGINNYIKMNSLEGCVTDAFEVNRVLERDADKEKNKNFTTELLVTQKSNTIEKGFLKDRIVDLFKNPRDISLLYFSGHGHEENGEGYLLTSECERGDDGLSMNSILKMANDSPATNRVIILDCCHAGHFGLDTLSGHGKIVLSEGVTVLAASAANQYAVEKNGSGVFTKLLIHALEGGAAGIQGEITPANVYGYIDKAMGETGQRPIFMTNVRRYTILRRIFSQINTSDLRKITDLFIDGPDMEFKLDPSFEPESDNPDPNNVSKFETLQLYNRVNLVVPIDASHMYFAAKDSKSCKLTPQGKSYWIMVNNNIL